MHFQKEVYRLNRRDIIWHSIIGFSVSGFGIFLLYLLNFTNWYDRTSPKDGDEKLPIWGVYLFIIFLLFMGLRELIKLKSDFKLKMIQSSVSVSRNMEIIEASFGELAIGSITVGTAQQISNNKVIGFAEFQSKNYWGVNHFYAFADEEGIYVCGHNYGSTGYVSSGSSQKQLRTIIAEIKRSL